jgi:hypothetical protein
MTVARFVLAAVLLSLFAACATQHRPPKAMALCDLDASLEGISPKLLGHALVEAQRYSNKTYGPDCYVCGQIYSQDAYSFMIHITSPVDLPLNTSAAITVRKSDGAVLSRGKWHSCYVRINNSPST